MSSRMGRRMMFMRCERASGCMSAVHLLFLYISRTMAHGPKARCQ